MLLFVVLLVVLFVPRSATPHRTLIPSSPLSVPSTRSHCTFSILSATTHYQWIPFVYPIMGFPWARPLRKKWRKKAAAKSSATCGAPPSRKQLEHLLNTKLKLLRDMMRSLQTLITRPEQLACSESNVGALIACSAGSEFQRQIPWRCLPKCVQEKEHSPTDFLLGKYWRGGFKVGLFALLLVLLFVSFSHFWRKNGEKETRRSAKRKVKRLTLNDTNLIPVLKCLLSSQLLDCCGLLDEWLHCPKEY
jgi:hypothetical protein